MIFECLLCYNCLTDYGFWAKRATVLCGELKNVSHQTYTCPKLTIEILEKFVEYVQSKQ